MNHLFHFKHSTPKHAVQGFSLFYLPIVPQEVAPKTGALARVVALHSLPGQATLEVQYFY
jgi:hypothetical protein